MSVAFRGRHFGPDIIRLCKLWYANVVDDVLRP
ncbi:hypothetical protein C8J36_110114 [Rhizobium sp. PP-F2F-G48]|nr:hypothetical protein C8J36_110113 [Rhizobium sp. PP-F2F-G48]TCM51107.1 hypothetical protein C8J36_110114 [Rhizobium sp. PP-F2F-G48]